MDCGLIGARLPRSHSPWLHAQLGVGGYRLLELAAEELEDFFRRRDFRGVNVTIPYKQAVIPYLDALDERAAEIGAVNTVVNRGGRLVGYNTDFDGLRALIGRAGIALAGKKVLILGTGGTAKTALAVCRFFGAAQALCVSRSPEGAAVSYEAACTAHADADVILNATPVGMGQDLSRPVDLACFPRLSGVIDVIYDPLRTALVQQALARGVPAAGGLYMLVRQAVRAAALFLDTSFDGDPTEALYRSLLRRVQSLVLIGMPTGGKTTVARQIAQKTGLPFVDTDEEIVRRSGMTIPALFAKRGEAAFRALETAVLRELCTGGQIVATGGGAVMNDENLALLRRNGRLIFLDRPLDELQPTADRPLIPDRDRLAALYAQRRPRYLAAADEALRIPGGSAADYAAAILARVGWLPSPEHEGGETPPLRTSAKTE